MKCPHGVETTWIILRNREESEQQILNALWDYLVPHRWLHDPGRVPEI
jgi:hypothetical protein